MAESAVTFLLNELSTWLKEEKSMLGGLRNEAQTIHDDLQQVRALLRDADATEQTDPKLKAFVKQVRDITHDMEDVLESYMLVSGRGTHGHIRKFGALIKNWKAKHKLAYEVKALRSRLKNVFETFQGTVVLLGSSSSVVANSTYYDGRGDALLLAESDVVGIERPKKQLLEWIGTSDYTLKVVSVVGMTGLGKTTLVKKVYDDPSLKKNIEYHAWVTVSNDYKVENLLLDLVKQLLEEVKQEPPQALETMNFNQVKGYIHKFLQNKKYAIVLDDVWSTNVWEALRYAFPTSSTCGRGCIIITTRNNEIGRMACYESGGHVYELKPLPSHKAEELFHKKAFLGGSCPDHLKEISKCILKRCEGLPLAIVVIGGALATKRNGIEEWTKFSLNMESDVEDDRYKRIWKLLSLSYYDLPYYLKACLLYLSLFPKDRLIEKPTITRLWITQGFVEAKQGKTMEEIAEWYLNELSSRSMIQVATSKDGRPRNFRIHDLVREYIILKAREHNIVAIKGSSEIRLEDRIRCLALDNSSIRYGEKINNLKYLRTVLFFGSVDLQWGPILFTILRGDCRMLKVLDLSAAPFDEIPNEVFKLHHLKYLSLRDTNVSYISKLIENLIKLEVLDLKRSKVVKLPVEIIKLQRLRYLLVYGYKPSHYVEFGCIQSVEAQCQIGQLLCLQKLCYIDANATIVKEIEKLTKLQRLGIGKVRKEHGKELCSSLANLHYLRSLNITAFDESEVIDLQYSMPPTSLQFLRLLVLEGRLEGLPQWIPSLKALTCLRLRWSKIRDEDPLEYLQQGLPNLQILEMYDAYDGEGLNFKSGGFQMLRELNLLKMKGLKSVRVEKESMPHLSRLEIADCEAMIELPQGIEHLTGLDEVEFTDMALEFYMKMFDERLSDKAEETLQRWLDDVTTSDEIREYVEKQLKKRRDAQKYHWKLSHIPKIILGEWVGGEWSCDNL